MEEKFFTEDEKYFVLTWMEKNCCGIEHARHRENLDNPNKGILSYMPKGIPDRKWRRIISVLIQEGHVYSSASFGYFFMPLVNPTPADIKAGKQALSERKTKALSSIEKVDQNMKKLEMVEQGTRDLFLS